MVRKYLFVCSGLIFLVMLLFFTALFAGFLPLDRDGYRYQYVDGHIIKIKTFAPPPGTVLMTEVIDGVVMNYYGTTTELQQ